jgi:ABC-type proline/glycine betaine transport system permease subunit
MWPTLNQTIWASAAVAGGVLLAIVVSLTEFGRRAVMPLLVVAQIVPKIAVAPLFMLWFGLGDLSRILIAFLVAFFPMVINTASGLSSVDHEVVLLGRAFARNRWEFFRRIQFPHALPYIFDGMKISITLAVIGVVVAEFVSSQEGLGYLIMFANGRLDTTMMMASIFVLSVIRLMPRSRCSPGGCIESGERGTSMQTEDNSFQGRLRAGERRTHDMAGRQTLGAAATYDMDIDSWISRAHYSVARSAGQFEVTVGTPCLLEL